MTNLQKQLRLNSILEAMKVAMENGIYSLSDETSNNFYNVTEEQVLNLDPLSESDLVTRAMMTKNLLTAFSIQNKHGNLYDPNEWGNVKQKLIDALTDTSFEKSDNEIAKELQIWNLTNAYRQMKRSNYLDNENVDNLVPDEVMKMIEETVNSDFLKEDEITAEDLVMGM
jgi:hypothetical protein